MAGGSEIRYWMAALLFFFLVVRFRGLGSAADESADYPVEPNTAYCGDDDADGPFSATLAMSLSLSPGTNLPGNTRIFVGIA